jgi:hypothetical protein
LKNARIYESITYQDIVKSIGGRKIQQGMNYRINGTYSVFLLNTSSRVYYHDRYEGGILSYQGHDIPSSNGVNPKMVDQPERNKTGSLTSNGKFYLAATKYKSGQTKEPESVRVYEKLGKNNWLDRGFFLWLMQEKENDGQRTIFKFSF